MSKKLTKAQEAQQRLDGAMADEAAAVERGGNPVVVAEAQGRKVEAANDLYAAQQPETEETVTLVSPNPEVTLTDSNNVQFENGVARGVPASLARMYVLEFGYEIQE
jgi:hypothetical protein